MFSVVSLLYVLGIPAKPNFESLWVYISNNPSSLARSEFKVYVFGEIIDDNHAD
jgi:hypothetical protein